MITPLDRVGLGNWRAWATARANGRVLKIGSGTGLNFSYYPPEARLIALDPDPEILGEIEDTGLSNGRVSILLASAMELPFQDGSFDAVVGTLVLCTIPEPGKALSEVRRVMKLGAPLRLVEHVRARNPVVGRMMDAVTPLWMSIAGGCHLNRNTFDTVRAAGFEIESFQEKWFGLFIGIDARR